MRRRILTTLLAISLVTQSVSMPVTAAQPSVSLEEVTMAEFELALEEITEETDVMSTDENSESDECTETETAWEEKTVFDTTEPVETEEPVEIAESVSEIAISDMEETSKKDNGSNTGSDINKTETVTEYSATEDTVWKSGKVNLFQEGSFDVTYGTNVDKNTVSAMDTKSTSGLYEEWKEVYAYILEQLKLRTASINIETYKVPSDTIFSIFSGVINENPDLYYVSGYLSWSKRSDGTVISITPTYITGHDDALFQEAMNDALSCIEPGMTDVEKAIALHDYIVVNTKYDNANASAGTLGGNDYNTYGILVERTGVCQGYALTYKLLCNKVGIECLMVSSNAMNHAWNLIKLDGEYYQVDTTWDDPTWDLLGRCRHFFMFVSDSAFETDRGHSDWVVSSYGETVDLKATSTTYDDYFWTDVDSAMIYDNHDYYYIENSDNTLKKIDMTDMSTQSLHTFNKWYVWESDSSYWTGTYSGLFENGERLYFNESDGIYSIDPENPSDLVKEFDNPKIEEGYIYGCALLMGEAKYVISQTPNFYKDLDVYTAVLTSEIEKEVTGVLLSDEEITLSEEEEYTLSYTCTPSGVTPASVTWSSSDATVATVTDGVVKALKTGNCDITITADGKTDTCKVTVGKPEFNVRFYDGDDCISTQVVKKGEDAIPPTVTPATGYEFTGWSGSYENIQEDTDLYAVYEPITYTIAYEVGDGTNHIENILEYTIETETFTLKEPTGVYGEQFIGWYTDEDYSAKITEITKGSTGDLTLYALWKLAAPVFSNTNSSVDKGTEISISANRTEADIYYTLDGSEPTKEAILYTGAIVINEAVTLKAIAVLEGYESSDVAQMSYVPQTSNFSLEKEEVTLKEEESVRINVAELPTGANLTDVSWKSADENVATVEDGLVTAVSAGETTITATVADYNGNSLTAECKVKVMAAVYTVTFKDADGTVLKEEEVEKGKDATPPTVMAPKGYEFIGWDDDYTNVTNDLVITARYELLVYNIVYVLNGAASAGNNPITYTVKDTISLAAAENKPGYTFVGWYTEADFSGNPIAFIESGSTGDITLYAKWRDERGLWMEDIEPQPYTGKKITLTDVEIYNGSEKLTFGTDYTISYKNNINANDLTGDNLSKAPAIVIKGKGNYSGSLIKNFVISQKNIEEEDVVIDDISLIYQEGKVQKPSPVVTWNGKKLKKNRDYTVSYVDENAEGAFSEVGEYTIIVEGCGNYAGSKEINLKIAESDKVLISKAKVVKIGNVPYTGDSFDVESALVLKYKNKTLTLNEDYELEYEPCVETGTHTIKIYGIGAFEGMVRTTFKIIGTSMSKVMVTGIPKTVYYTGQPIDMDDSQWKEDVTLTISHNVDGEKETVTLDESQYDVTYINNTQKGKAKIVFTGKNGYTGTLIKSFTIKAYDIHSDLEEIMSAEMADDVVYYTKGGATPKLMVKAGDVVLTEGKDYTVSYKNNKSVNLYTDDKADAIAIVNGKGNYTGKMEVAFEIEKRDIATVTMFADDVEERLSAGKYKSKPVLTDENGKKLMAGKDYEKVIEYRDEQDVSLGDRDIVSAGATITVTVYGKGCYEGENSTTYRIVGKKMSISKAKVTVKKDVKWYYTGDKVTIQKEDLIVKIGKTVLSPDNFEITGYSNNENKGTAKVTIKGKGEYGGTKTVFFKINGQPMKWWNLENVLAAIWE